MSRKLSWRAFSACGVREILSQASLNKGLVNSLTLFGRKL